MTIQTLDPIKAGETLVLYLNFSVDGKAEVFDESELELVVRDRDDNVVGEAVVTAYEGAPGVFMAVVGAAVTADWSPGDHYCDVKRTVSTYVIYSDSVLLPVERAQTR